MDFKWFLCCCFVIVTFDPATTDQTSTISTPATPTGERLIGKSELACQRYTNIRANFEGDAQKCIVKRVINGNPVERNEFPHMVALGYDRNDENDTSYDFLCGGTLISDKFVLTAFHCVGRRNAVPRIARLGKVNIAQMNQWN